MRVLVTRAPEDAARTARALAALGHEAILAPLRECHRLEAPWPEGAFAALVATSRHALADVPAHLRALPLHCVGRKTAGAARAAGFTHVHTGASDGLALATDIIGKLSPDKLQPSKRLLYLAGRPRHPALEAALEAAGLHLTVSERYIMTRVPSLPTAARAALSAGTVDAVVHFSAESARAWLALSAAAGLAEAACLPRHLCLSRAIANVLEAYAPHPDVRVAATPDEDALLELLMP